jgi:hypothetical protein
MSLGVCDVFVPGPRGLGEGKKIQNGVDCFTLTFVWNGWMCWVGRAKV